MKKKLLAMLLSVILMFTFTTPAFAATLPQENVNVDFLALSAVVCSSDADTDAAAKNAYENLTPTQQQEFLALIEALAYQGDTQLVEFHKAHVDPSYEFTPDGIMPQAAAVAAAADVAGQLQALNLPATVYYGLLAFATSLGIPVGNVVDLVIGLGLAVIIVANWDTISGVWDEIIDIFVDAFGSVVMEAFYYLQGLVGVYTVAISGKTITVNNDKYECDTRADYAAATMKNNGHSYYPAVLSGGYVWVAPIDIPRKVALAIMKKNSSTAGVFTVTSNLARDLCGSLGGEIGPENHGSGSGYWWHYHGRNCMNAHCWYLA